MFGFSVEENTLGAVIYLDHNATTPTRAEVREAVLPFLSESWGNPSSSYRLGVEARNAVEEARGRVAQLINARPTEVLFTGHASEANNTAVNAALKANPNKRHIITSRVEHSSVLNHCRALERDGYEVTYLPVTDEGRLQISSLELAFKPNTAVVSLMWANNETGVIFPVAQIAAMSRARGVLFHCDAVQAAGKLPIDVASTHVDFLSLTGHKIGAPKGVGMLYVHRRAPFTPYLFGGHQERGRRGGTENVALIAGLGRAADLALAELGESERIRARRDEFEQQIMATIAGTKVNGHRHERLPNTTNISFQGTSNEALLMLLDRAGICASAGSACLADSTEPSHVIAAMRENQAIERDYIRFSIGSETTDSELSEAAGSIARAVATLRAM